MTHTINKRTFKQWQITICQRDDMRFENDREHNSKALDYGKVTDN